MNNLHPVHIMTKENSLSPSAFIPFCDFGGNMSSMGVKIDQFDVPVCNCFQAKILNDQLCYEVDLKSLSNRNNINRELKSGFNFIMDYNEDRQVTLDKQSSHTETEDKSLASKIKETDDNLHAFIYLNTVGMINII